MGPSAETRETTPQSVQPLTNDLSQFLQLFLQDPTASSFTVPGPAGPTSAQNPRSGQGLAAPGGLLHRMGTINPQPAGGSPPGTTFQNPLAGVLSGPSPEEQALAELRPFLEQLFGQLSPEGTIAAAQPIFDRQLESGLGALASAAPSTANTAFQRQGIDLSSQAIQDFNLFSQSAIQQALQQQTGVLALGGQLAASAGQGQRQSLDPFVQLLGLMGQFARPGSETIVKPGALDYATQLAPLGFFI